MRIVLNLFDKWEVAEFCECGGEYKRWKYVFEESGKIVTFLQSTVQIIVDRKHLTGLGVEETITLKWMLNKQGSKMWTELCGLEMGPKTTFCANGHESFVRVFKSRRMKWVGNVERVEEEMRAQGFGGETWGKQATW